MNFWSLKRNWKARKKAGKALLKINVIKWMKWNSVLSAIVNAARHGLRDCVHKMATSLQVQQTSELLP